MSAVRPLLALAGAGYARYTTYRAAQLGGAFTNAVFGLLRASILTAALTSRGGPVGGYDRATAVTFAWASQALIAVVEIFTWNELALRVRTGDIAVDLARPLDPQLAYGAADLGRAAAVILPRAVPILLVGAVTTGVHPPRDPWAYPLGAVAVITAALLSFALRFAVNLAAFWLVEVRGLIGFYVTVSSTLSGLVLPLTWFPGWLAAIAHATPFPSLVQLPADVLVGRLGRAEAVVGIGVQAAWLGAALVLGRVVLAAGRRRLVVQGG